jgi:hypothetical protein
MNRRLLLTLAAGLTSAVLFSARAQAGTVVAMANSGGSSIDMLGTGPGAMLTSDPYADTIASINGASVSIPLTFGATITSSAGTITGFTGEETIGTGSVAAILDFSGTTGTASRDLLFLSGTVTKIV